MERPELRCAMNAADKTLAEAGLGDKDAAFRWLERAYGEHASFMDGLKVTPAFDGLHSDPRFTALLERMHL
jgi:hypothetical protein